MKLAPPRVHSRIAFTYCKTDGGSVLEYEPEGKAADEIRELFYWMCRQVGVRVGRGQSRARIQPAQLPRWLELFRETAHERCPPVAAAFLLDIAERMAENMSFGLDARDQRTKATE